MDQNNIIFLAYAREDERYVKRLYQTLKENGLHPWMDQENLTPGEHWRKKTETILKNARFFLACLSRQSISKNGEIQKELRTALGEFEKKAPDHIYFIPVLLEDVELPDISVGTIHLRDYQAVNVFEAEGLQKLIRQLRLQTNMVKCVRKKKGPEQSIQHYIAEGRINTALKLLNDHVEMHHSEWSNDVILLTSRYHNLEKQHGRGIISREQHLLEKNRITHAVLELLGRLP